MSTWALVGAPNSGKTTLYNWLTGARAKTVNYPGSTVEYSRGSLRSQLVKTEVGLTDQRLINLIDTPGVYSLHPQSEDEQVTHRLLFGTERAEKITGLIVVLDATQLARQLLLARQTQKTGYHCIYVLTMRDLLDREGAKIQIDILQEQLQGKVFLFDGTLGGGLQEIANELESQNALKFPKNLRISAPALEENEEIGEQLIWASTLSIQSVLKRSEAKSAKNQTAQIDRWLLHRFFGPVIFIVLMITLFTSVYWLAQPAMEVVDQLFGALAQWVPQVVPGLAGEFVGQGLIAAFGGVVIFIPQIFILFVGIGLLESSGYLSRAAALIDRPLSLVGLGGRSFVPILSGFACAIPAIMATRNITSKREKWLAQIIIPFMTCSARLPVYALLIGFLFGPEETLLSGLALTALYFGAILIGAVAARIFSLLAKDQTGSRLLLELPLYRRPKLRVIFLQAFDKSKSFVLKAGPVLIVLALILWSATNFPRERKFSSSAELAQQSYAAQVGKYIEPIFTPLGADWRVGFAIISSFAAREVFVSALALMLSVESADEADSVLAAMRAASFADGRPLFTTASAVSLLIFFMIALQCTSTVGVLKKEMGSWPPALLHLLFSNVFAYALAAGVFYMLS